jgi:hypothetical protein
MAHVLRVFVTLLLVARYAPAADQALVGKLVMVKNNLDPAKRLVKYLAKEKGTGRTVEGNPMSDGATFEIVLQPEIGTLSQQCFGLPGSGWSPISTLGYKYKDQTGANGPVKVAQIKTTPSGTFMLKVIATAKNSPVTLQPPIRTAEADVFFRIVGGDRYCSTFGGVFLNDGVSQFKAKNADAPGACADVSPLCSPSGAFVDVP